MRGKLFILAVLSSGLAFGQSSMDNVAYRPQPRILIPHVAPQLVTVSTNGTITANPARNLLYTDFVLCAVDQSGTKTNPVLFQFSTIDTNAQDSATVFYQRAGTNWPAAMQRRAGTSYTATNWTYTVTTNSFAVYTNWNLVVSATNYPSFVVISGSTFTNQPAFGAYTNAGRISPMYSRWDYDQHSVYCRVGTTWKTFYGSGASDLSVLTAYGTNFLSGGMTAEVKTNSWGQTITTNSSYEVVSVNILSIQSSSSNEAGAIEVYPVRQPRNRTWMKQTNPDVKWMALLSNGSNFYSTASGSPIWFNCWVEWVDKIPANGVH